MINHVDVDFFFFFFFFLVIRPELVDLAPSKSFQASFPSPWQIRTDLIEAHRDGHEANGPARG